MENRVIRFVVISLLALVVDKCLSLDQSSATTGSRIKDSLIFGQTILGNPLGGEGNIDDSEVDDQRHKSTKIFHETTVKSLAKTDEYNDENFSQRKFQVQKEGVDERRKSDRETSDDRHTKRLIQKHKTKTSELYIQILFVSVTIAFLAAAALGLLYITYFMFSGINKYRGSKTEKHHSLDSSHLSDVFSVIPSDSNIWREMKENPEV